LRCLKITHDIVRVVAAATINARQLRLYRITNPISNDGGESQQYQWKRNRGA
jgi:hypothetical protein